MSLFLGNLSSRIRLDELEREFRRFGPCNIRLKDRFGFVIYDFPTNAEKALRVLRGRRICGHPIDITWANKQPKPFKKYRSSRDSEPYNGRSFFRRKDHEIRERGSHNQTDSELAAPQVTEGEEPRIDDMLEKETGHIHEDDVDHRGEKQAEIEKGLLDEGYSVEPNLGGGGRWGDPFIGPLNDQEAKDGAIFDRYVPYPEPIGGLLDDVEEKDEAMFDRYEPYHDYDRSEDDEYQRTSSHGSPTQKNSREKLHRSYIHDRDEKHPSNFDPQQKCHIHGSFGHKMRNCVQADAFRPEKFRRFDRHQDFRNSAKRGLRRLTPASGRNSYYNRSLPLSRRYKRDREVSGHATPLELVRKESSFMGKETGRLRCNSESKRKRRKEDGHQMKYEAKAKMSRLSDQQSISCASSSHSHSRSSEASSSSSSRLVSSRIQSASSRSGSVSTSSCSESESYRSRSKSRSIPIKEQMENTGISSKSYLEKDSRKSKQHLIDQRHSTQNNASADDVPQKITNMIQSDRKKFSYAENNKNNSGLWDEHGRHAPCRTGDAVKTSCSTLEKGNFASDNLHSEDLGERKDHEISRSQVMEDAQVSFEKHKALVIPENNENNCDDDVQHAPHRTGDPIKSSCNNLEKGNPAVDDLYSEDLGERRDHEISRSLVMEDTKVSSEKQKAHLSSQGKRLTSISSQELYSVLKHYSLAVPNENRENLSVENYFGSARLWPWEIVYYRRLKKGSISTENYTRRIAQNEEFGIVDKYIRSSSGWYE